MGGISAVMAHPAYRRRGYAGELMRAVLRDMRERNVSLSLLAPFAHAFYRIFGYELATEAIEYRLKPADLPTSPEQSHLRAYREDDLSSLMDLYEAEAAESVSLDVRQLAQLYAGYLPARDLARHGLIRASSPGALDLLETLFPLRDP